MRSRALTFALAAVSAAVLAAACGGDTDDDEDRVVATTAPAEPPTTTATEPPTTKTATTVDRAGGRCSASGLGPHLEAQPGLPAPVAETRRRIAAAATACDFEALARLAREGGEPFTHSFGDSGDPAAYWRQEEEAGREPLRFLVEVLRRPYRMTETQGVVRYAWPAAFTYSSWDDVPPADREALKPLYDDGDLVRFQQFGGYIGYRVVMLADGDWTAFVAGD